MATADPTLAPEDRSPEVRPGTVGKPHAPSWTICLSAAALAGLLHRLCFFPTAWGWLGWIALVLTAVGLFLACIFGVILGLAVRAATNGQRHFPFGPGLAAGTMVAIWFSTPILNHITG